MERQIFTWSGWDQQGTMAFTFYDCLFKKDFGPWKAGDFIKFMYVDYEEGIMASYADDAVQETNKVSLKLEVLA